MSAEKKSSASQVHRNCQASSANLGALGIHTPNTVVDLMTCLEEMNAEGPCVWRGQANYMWAPIPSLYRRLRNGGLSDGQINEGAIKQTEQEMVDRAKAARLVSPTADDVLRFMIDMQHFGGATRLLDVTHDFKVALFFACQSNSGSMGELIRYKISPSRTLRQKDGATWADITASDAGRPILLEPLRDANYRVEAQHAAFITTVLDESLAVPNIFSHETAESRADLVWIGPKLKSEIIEQLSNEGITEQTLFSAPIESFAPKFGTNVRPWFLA